MKQYSFIQESEYFLNENKFSEDLGRRFVRTATKNNGICGKLARGTCLAHGATEAWTTTKAPFVMPAPDYTAVKHFSNAVNAIIPRKDQEKKENARRKAAVATGRFIRHPLKSVARMGKRFLGLDLQTTGINADPNDVSSALGHSIRYLNAGAHVYGSKAKSTISNWLSHVRDKFRNNDEQQLNPIYAVA